ncbi:LysM domain-containing protein, partial [Paenibacillus macerans]|nr:LysM domain-containing protein [Paenibacillus macerans]
PEQPAPAEEPQAEAKPVKTPSKQTISQPAAAKDTVYTVEKGDNLYRIAIKHGTTWQALAKYNKLANPHLIHIGQKIVIPAK